MEGRLAEPSEVASARRPYQNLICARLCPCQARRRFLPFSHGINAIAGIHPVAILGLVAFLFAAGTLVASVVVGKRGQRSAIKDTAYECGMLPVGQGNTRLSVKFYLVAMLFILFDIEENEQHGDEIKLDRKAGVAFADGQHAAFISGVFDGGVLPRLPTTTEATSVPAANNKATRPRIATGIYSRNCVDSMREG